jgi:archaellum component FlaG (FlaF/FlaG flagellin family)
VRGSDAFRPQGGSATAANALEDVYLYDLGKVSLKPGERLTKPLFHVTTAYEMVNTWSDVGSQAITKLLRIKNDSSLPLTPGSCMVLKDGKLLAMTSMPYASPTQSVDIEMGTVLDLKVATETTVTGTRRVADTTPQAFIYSWRKTVVLENPRDEEVLFEITTEVDGHIIDAGGAKVTAVEKYFNRPPYFRQSVVWKVAVAPRSIKELRVAFETRSN